MALNIFDKLRQIKLSLKGGRLDEPQEDAQRVSRWIDDGNQLLDQGRIEEARQCYTAAIEFMPGSARAHLNLGNAWLAGGDAEKALDCYAMALAHKPDYAAAHYNMGNANAQLQSLPAALDCYRRALELQPDFLDAEVAQGNVLDDLERFEDAAQSYRRALLLKPGDAGVGGNLANVIFKLGRLDEARGNGQAAIDRYAAALALAPENVMFLSRMGFVQQQLQLFEDAVASYSRVLRLQPEHAEVCDRLVSVLMTLGRLDEAVQACHWALEMNPNSANAHHNLGVVLQEQGRWLEAHAAYRMAMAERRDFGAAQEGAYACAGYLCDWSHRAEDERALLGMVGGSATAIRPFSLLGMGEAPTVNSALLQLQAGRQYAELALEAVLANPVPRHSNRPAQEARLSIGYLSADFHEHATMHLLQGVLATHDRERFKVHAYSYGMVKDGITRKVQATCEVFRDLAGMSDEASARQIALDGVSILIDLKGYTKGGRLAIQARRPAPVVVSWLGYPGTLGHAALADYIIGDATVTPAEHAAHFSETLALMPHCYQPNDRQRAIGNKPTRAQAGLPAEGFVFCSFNQTFKLNPDSFDVWCRLLKEVPGSVLWLLSMSTTATDNLRREAQLRGVNAERLIFAPPLPLASHLARLQLADLALDTFPYNSHTTGSDALWAGVPLVTRMGSTFASRVAASLLHNVNLPGLITRNWEDYLALAKSLALNPPRLQAIRQELKDTCRCAPLFDTERFTRDLERLYRQLWEQHGRGEKRTVVLRDLGTRQRDTGG
jgi:predicted O-linked N-acetylglucosamine transferase (SPINDLY family)/regulator of sirC expression with transglutaminase-like and TPR domain